MTGFSSVQTPQELEKRSLRRDANYIGFMMLGMTAAMQFTFTALVYFLLSLGVLRPEQVTMDQLGLSNSAFLLLYALVYTFAMAIPPDRGVANLRTTAFPAVTE